MAISWLLKQRIRINPNIIYRLTEEELTEEVVEFVLAQPRFNMQKIRYNGVVFKSETFVKAYINSPDFKKQDINNIFNQADNFSEELKKTLIDKVMAEGIDVGATYVKESMITNNPEFFIYLLEKNNGQLPYFYERGGISLSSYSNEQIDRIYELMTTADPDIEYSRVPGYIRTSDRMFNHFLSNKFEETIKGFEFKFKWERDINDRTYINIKNFVLNNLDITLPYIGLATSMIQLEFTDEEKTKIIEAAREIGVKIDNATPQFLLEDKDVFIKSIATMEDISIINRIDLSKMQFTEEDVTKFAEKIEEFSFLKLVRENREALSRISNKDARILNRVVQKTPLYYEFLTQRYYSYIVSPPEVTYGMYNPKNNNDSYIYTRDGNQEFLIESLRRDFNGTLEVLRDGGPAFTLEQHKQIYMLAKENDFEVTEKIPGLFRSNPYFLAEAQKRGVLRDSVRFDFLPMEIREKYYELTNTTMEKSDASPEEISRAVEYLISHNVRLGSVGDRYFLKEKAFSSYSVNYPYASEAIKSPEFIIRTIQKDFSAISMYDYSSSYADMDSFSEEDHRRVFEEIRKAGILDRLEQFEDYVLVANNPFVILEYYVRTGKEFNRSNHRYLSDEQLNKMAEIYRERSNKPLSKESLDVERTNPYIILESIKQDPLSIDFVQIDSKVKSDEVKDAILEKIKSGEYKLNKNTSKTILLLDEVVDYIIDSDEFDYVYLLGNVYQAEQEEKLRKKVLDYIKSGNQLKESVSVLFSKEEIKEILTINPNEFVNIKVLLRSDDKEEKEAFHNDITRILIDGVKSGKLVANKELIEKLDRRYPKVIQELVHQDPSSLLFMSPWYTKNPEEMLKILMDEMKAGTLNVPDTMSASALLYREGYDENELIINEELFKYVVGKNPNLLKSFITNLEEEYVPEKELYEYALKYVDFSKIVVKDDESLEWMIKSKTIFFEYLKHNKDVLKNPMMNNLNVKFTEQELQEFVEIIGKDYKIDENTPPFISKNVQISTFLTRGVFVPPMPDKMPPPPGKTEYTFKKERPLSLLSDRDFERIKEDLSLVDQINPTSPWSNYKIIRRLDEVTELLLESGYILNENTILPFRYNPQIIIESIKRDPSSIKYAIEQDYSDELKNEILQIIMEAEPKVRLDSDSLPFMRSNYEYITHSLEGATPEEIKNVLDSVLITGRFGYQVRDSYQILDLVSQYILEDKYSPSRNIDPYILKHVLKSEKLFIKALQSDFSLLKDSYFAMDEYSKEDQEIIYNLYRENAEEFVDDKDVLEMMQRNSFYVMDYVREHLDEIEQISFEGLKLTEEFKSEIREYYLANGLKINENTPSFVKRDNDFVYRYLKNNDGELNGLDVLDVAPLLTFEELYEHPEYMEFTKYYDQFRSGYELFFEKWGKEKTLEYVSKLGNLVKFLEPGKDYDIETLYRDFEVLVLNKNDFSVDETISILSTINITLSPDYFKTNTKFRTNDRIFLKVLENNPNLITEYDGENEEVMKKAIDSGLELTEEILAGEKISKSSAIFTKILEEKPELFMLYKGSSEEIIEAAVKQKLFSGKTKEELDEIFKSNEFYASSSVLFDSLLDEYDVDEIAARYNGSSEEIFKKVIDKGLLTGKTEEEVIEFLTKQFNYSKSDAIYLAAFEEYSSDILKTYNGNSEEVFVRGVEKGFKIDVEFFRRRAELIKNKYLLEEGIKNDKYCEGLVLYDLSLNKEVNRDKIVSIIQNIIGDENYQKIITDSDVENEIINLCTISGSAINGVTLLKTMDYDLMSKLGFDKWKTIVKYSFNNPDNKELMSLIENKKSLEFLEIYERLQGIIDDDKALGVNKFLKFVGLYNANPELLKSLDKKVKEGQVLSDEEKVDFQIIMYGNDKTLRQDVTIDDLGKLTEIERDVRLQRLKQYSGNQYMYGSPAKDDLATFLFNMNSSSLGELLKRDINTQTILKIMNRAKKDGKESLYEDSQYMYVLIDMIEQFHAVKDDNTEMIEFAKRIYESDPKKLAQIRKSFFNITETVRNFYEREAQSELTNIASLINNPEFVEKDGEDIIVDLSKSKHTLYAHVLSPGMSIPSFFNTDRGKVTICVSPETDIHEAYYGGNPGTNVVFGFDSIPRGSFIGSSTVNMGSNSVIDYNDYSDDRVRLSYNQRSVRDSYHDSEHGSAHAETLLYRKDLIPSCIILTTEEPTEQDRNARRELEMIINKGLEPTDPNYKVIPFVRTQTHKNRVYSYEKELPSDPEKTIIDTKQERRTEELRKKFHSIFGFSDSTDLVVRTGASGKYVIKDDSVYIIQDIPSEKVALKKTAALLQGMVRGEEEPKGLELITVPVKGSEGTTVEKTAIKDIDARSMWNYNRTKGTLSLRSNKLLMQEFLVDHLMCNYASTNSAFLLDIDDNVYGIDKTKSFEAVDDFISKDGRTYTSMSYLYFDASAESNMYRRVFEDYIRAENPDEVIPRETIQEFISTADKISEMDDEEYLGMFGEYLDTIDSQEKREKIENVILMRKQNAGKDSREFVDRLEKLRQADRIPEEIVSTDTVAFVNDVHGNAEALKAIFEECRTSGKKDVFILGDMIGFGPQSNECLDIIREEMQKTQESGEGLQIRCILGNHELYSIMGNKSFLSSNGFEAENTRRVREELSPENRAFIESLPLSRKLVIDGKKVELSHFPIKKSHTRDSSLYYSHGESFVESDLAVGQGQEFLIYGHEHRTETTSGDEVGTTLTTKIGNTDFINLPSSGCVHGGKTSFVTISFETEGEETKMIPTVESVDYDREKLDEVLIDTKNPKAHFFGGIKKNNSGGEYSGR